jgi:hypothetical protein
MEYSGNVQEIFREYSGNMHAMYGVCMTDV